MKKGKLLGIWARRKWGGEMTSLHEANLVTGKGLTEDVSFGGRRQITIIEQEKWQAVTEKLNTDLPPESRRANFMIEGINLEETKGRILKIGECRIQISGETKPCAAMDEKFPGLKIVGSQPSRFRQVTADEQAEIAETIRRSGASIVLVGLGCPRQETWVFENRELISIPLLAVGAAFDFHAGTVSQAPLWFQNRGLEWLFRFVQEPRRLWKRYAFLNPLYLLLVVLQMAKLRIPALEDNVSPPGQMRFG